MHASPVGPSLDRFHRYEIHPVTLLHRLKPTTDQGRFYRFDPIKAAEDCGTTPGKAGLSSKSVNDCRLSARAGVKVRVPNNVGITGGIVVGATRADDCETWGKQDVLEARRTPGSRKARRAAAKRA